MAKLSELELKKLIRGGETNTVELKIAAPRATEMAERLCGMANAQGGLLLLVSRMLFMKLWACLIIVLAKHWMFFYEQPGK